MSEPQDKQELPSDVAGDNPPAVETTAGDDAKDNDGGRDLSKANPLNQAAKGAAPGRCLYRQLTVICSNVIPLCAHGSHSVDSNQVVSKTPALPWSGVPRTIRSRTGQTEDPVPEGKHVAEHKCALQTDLVGTRPKLGSCMDALLRECPDVCQTALLACVCFFLQSAAVLIIPLGTPLASPP